MESGSPIDLNPKGAAGRAKPQFHLIPIAAQVPIAKVMELGAKKYGPHNWRDTPVNYTTYLSAASRHVNSFLDGQDQDPESGQSHLAHAAAGLMILLDAIVTGNAVDDRPKKNPAYVEPAPAPVRPKLTTGEAVDIAREERGVMFGYARGICACRFCARVRELFAEQPGDAHADDGAAARKEAAPQF